MVRIILWGHATSVMGGARERATLHELAWTSLCHSPARHVVKLVNRSKRQQLADQQGNEQSLHKPGASLAH